MDLLDLPLVCGLSSPSASQEMTVVTTSRNVFDDVSNTIDYLVRANLVYYANSVSLTPYRVSWHAHDKSVAFLSNRDHPSVSQYLAWLTSGAYTVILFDGSLLQLTYDIAAGVISGHRLAYIPCPLDMTDLLAKGRRWRTWSSSIEAAMV